MRTRATRWGHLDLAAEAIRGQINGATRLNKDFVAQGIATPTLVPHSFYGAYAQAAYKAHLSADYTLSPFARYEILNTAASYGSMSAGAGTKQPTERILTLGANLQVGEGAVLKADYRLYRQHKLPDSVDHFTLGNSLNFGVGFAF